MSFSTEAPSRLMRAPVDSRPSTMRPLRFSRERISSCSLAGSSTQRSSSAATTVSASREVVGAGADVQADLARAARTGWRRRRPSRPARGARAPPGTAARRTSRRARLRAPAARSGARRRARSPRPPTHTWYCSVSFARKCARGVKSGVAGPRRALRRHAACAGGGRARSRRGPCSRARRGRSSRRRRSRCCRACSAAAWNARELLARRPRRRPRRVPITARPSGCAPKIALPSMSKTRSWGSSSYIAISSSTTSRSASSSPKRGLPDHVAHHVEGAARGGGRARACTARSPPCRCRR